jgi:hypothetical protein
VDFHPSAPAAVEVRIDKLNPLDDSIVSGQVDHSAARSLPEEVPQLRRPARAVSEDDPQIQDLEIRVVNHQRQLIEPGA